MILDSIDIEIDANERLVHDFFNSSHENLLTDESLFIIFDKDTADQDRTIQITQVADCIAIAIWGKTREGKDFISLIHKSVSSYVKQLMTEFENELKEAELAYLIIPGPESGDKAIEKTKEECLGLLGNNERTDLVPELEIVERNRKYDRTSVAIKGRPDNAPSILVLRPNFD